MQPSSLAGVHMHNEDADSCRSPTSEHRVASQSSMDNLVTHTQGGAGTAAYPFAGQLDYSNPYVGYAPNVYVGTSGEARSAFCTWRAPRRAPASRRG